MEIIKEHNSNDSKLLRSKGHECDKENTSQPIDFLIDLDGLDDWLNKTNAPAEDTISQDLLSIDFNQCRQSGYQTKVDKARKNTSNIDDKVSGKVKLLY